MLWHCWFGHMTGKNRRHYHCKALNSLLCADVPLRNYSLTHNAITWVIPCQYRHKWYIVKNYILWPGLHFCRRKYPYIFNHFYAIRTESYRIRWNYTQPLGLLRRSRSFNVIEFGTNRKLICDFLLVINSNLSCILHRFWDTAFQRSKSLHFSTAL